jgi:hypothetical protein
MVVSTSTTWTQREKNILGAAIAIIAAVIITAAIIVYSVTLTIPSSGTVTTVGVGIYWDAATTKNVTSVPWGYVNPGGTYGVTVFAKDTQDTNITLSINTTAWTPATATKYLTFSWNYTSGRVIAPSQVIPVEFELAIASNVTGITTFSFNINIEGTAQT